MAAGVAALRTGEREPLEQLLLTREEEGGRVELGQQAVG